MTRCLPRNTPDLAEQTHVSQSDNAPERAAKHSAASLSPWLLALAPVPAVVVGALVASRAGVPLSAFAPNGGAIVLGAATIGLAVRCPSRFRDRASVVLAVLATALIVRTLVQPGLEGVHRWLPLGPLRLHASMALAPWIAVALARASHRGNVLLLRLCLSLALTAQAAHMAQPDAQMAFTLALGLAPLLLADRTSPRLSWLVCASLLVLAVLTLWQPDPLAPVAHVEGIFALALAQGVGSLALAVGSLGVLVVPLGIVAWGREAGRATAIAAACWMGTQVAMTGVGAFPVPVLGAGAAGVLGVAVWLGALGALGAETRSEAKG